MIIAAIPVRNQIRWTAPLIEQILLGDEVDEVWVYDNGSTDLTKEWVHNRAMIDSRLMYLPEPDMRLYDMWNDMIRRAAEIGNVKLAILNNDIRLPHNALKSMAELMDGHQISVVNKDKSSFESVDAGSGVKNIHWPDRVGWAFMLDADFWKDQEFAIHPDLIIWWGDDDLFRRAEKRGGKICRILGVGANHTEMSSDSEYRGDKWADVELDRETFRRIWS